MPCARIVISWAGRNEGVASGGWRSLASQGPTPLHQSGLCDGQRGEQVPDQNGAARPDVVVDMSVWAATGVVCGRAASD